MRLFWLLLISCDKGFSLSIFFPDRVPGLLLGPDECNGLEAQADEDLGEHREQQRPWD